MYLALSICVLFVSLMQLVNGAHFLNTTFLPSLSGSVGVSTHTTVIVTLTSKYASL